MEDVNKIEMKLPVPTESLTLQSQVLNFHPLLQSRKGAQS